MNDSTLLRLYKSYDSHDFSLDDFENDVLRITYVFRIIEKYIKTGECNTRLLLNHAIILRNVFGTEFLVAAEEFGETRSDKERLLFSTLMQFLNLIRKSDIDEEFLQVLINETRS